MHYVNEFSVSLRFVCVLNKIHLEFFWPGKTFVYATMRCHLYEVAFVTTGFKLDYNCVKR